MHLIDKALILNYDNHFTVRAIQFIDSQDKVYSRITKFEIES